MGDTGSLVRVYRPELQGLRAVAVALVVVYHVWFGRVSGGVDVFFVISGFLLTGQLVRAAGRGPLELGRRWSRTLVRLLPCAVVVLVATVVAGALLLPEGRWPQTLREVVAAALFLENWRLAADTVDYAARSAMSSPVQHFWSLSIQGQFFLVWPLLVALVVARRAGRRRPGARGRPSWSARRLRRVADVLGGADRDEPGAGVRPLADAAVGVRPRRPARPDDRHGPARCRRTRVRLGWVGLAGLVACGAVLRVERGVPGRSRRCGPPAARSSCCSPGAPGARNGADRLLASRPLRYLGDLSYPLYLWHWPVLVFALVLEGRDRLDAAGGAAVVGTSLLLAVATHHLVERPVRGPSPEAGRRWVAVGRSAAVFLAAGLWQGEALRRAQGDGQVGDVRYPGALALVAGAPGPAPLLPPPVAVTEDWVRIEHWDCAPMARFPMDVCAQPVAAPERRIVVVGDSHTQQLAGALVPIAARHHWQLIAIVRGRLPVLHGVGGRRRTSSTAWTGTRPRRRRSPICARTPWSPWPAGTSGPA